MHLPKRLIKGTLIDITGVLYDYGASHAIPGSLDGMRKLSQSGLPFKLVTNQAKDKQENLIKYLHDYGFDMIRSDHLFAPVAAAVHYMKKNKLTNPYLLVPPKIVEEFAAFDGRANEKDCVVIGDAGDDLSYKKMNEAFRILTNMQQPILISLGSSLFYRFKQELLLDVGPYVKALEHASDVQAIVIGKPSADYFMTAVSSMGLPHEDVVMIGDDMKTDIEAANKCGLTGILVKTGKGQSVDHSQERLIVVDDFNSAVDLILQTQQLH